MTRPIAILFLLLAPAVARAQFVNNGGAVATSVNVSTLNTGNVIDVTPTVSADGRYVIIGLNLQFSSLEGIDTFVVPLSPLPSNGTLPVMGLNTAHALAIGRSPVSVLTRSQTSRQSENPWASSRITTLANLPPGPATSAPAGVIFIEHDPKLLAAEVPALSGENISLSDAVKRLSLVSKTNLVLGTQAFKQAGIDVKAPIAALQIPTGPMRDTLDSLMKSAAPDQALVITAEDNVVYITTQAQADHNIVSKTYYVEDLLGNSPQWLAKSGGQSGDKVQQTGGGGVMELIVRSVRPEIWKVNGGKIGEIFQLDNRITIKAPESVHAILSGPKHYNPNQVPKYIIYGTQ